MGSLSKYVIVKEIIKNLTIMMFCPPQDDKPLSEASDLAIVKEGFVLIAMNPLVCYIFLKVCLQLYIIPFSMDYVTNKERLLLMIFLKNRSNLCIAS